MRSFIKLMSVLSILCFVTMATAQKNQYSRATDQTGLNVFEPAKADASAYEGFKLQIGGAFRQSYQMLNHENIDTSAGKINKLYPLGNGFNLAAANLNFDVQYQNVS